MFFLLLACQSSPETTDKKPHTAAPLDFQSAINSREKHNKGYGGVSLGVWSPPSAWLYQGSAGDAWVDGPEMTPDATFEIASITKTFTAVAIIQLAEEGRLSLDDPMNDYLPELMTGLLVVNGQDEGPNITLRQLLQHTSGLPDYWADPPFVEPGVNSFLRAFMADTQRVWEPLELIDYARDLNPIGRPGEVWHYSDTNYVLLGLLLEKLEGKPYDVVIRDRILTPLNLSDTYLSYHETATSDKTESHRYEFHEDLYQVPRQSADWAGGGLVSSQQDLALFLGGMADGTLLSAARLDEMLEDVPIGYPDYSYGLGLFLIDFGAHKKVWGHEGHGGAFAYWWPDSSEAIVGTVNQTETDWVPLGAAVVAD